MNIALAWSWVRQSADYMKNRPFELFLLFLAYVISVILLNMLPLINRIAALFQPLLMVAFYYACVQIENKQVVTPSNIFLGFRSSMRFDLLKLGAINALWTFFVLYASTWIDDGVLWKFLNSKQAVSDMKEFPVKELLPGMSFVALFYVGFTSITSFAIPLIEFKKVPVFKALFFSVYGFFKNIQTMLAFGLIMFGMTVLVSLILVSIPILMVPAMVLMSMLIYYSQYPMYKSLFGE